MTLSDADLAGIRAAAPPGLVVERFRRDFASLRAEAAMEREYATP